MGSMTTTSPEGMTPPAGVLPYERELTRDERDALPDDGHRQELIDGCLIVTPAPSAGHQVAALELFFQLRQQVPDELRVLAAPLDVALDDRNVLQPDVLVARKEAFTSRELPQPPLLAVEVLSPSTRLIDLNLKKARYEASGCPSYWVVDPGEESITVWELAHSSYSQVGQATGDQSLELTTPFPATVRLTELFE